MVRTRVGYSGGQKKDPSYRSLGDHSETLQIDYDPSRISYHQLLDIFWQNHDPTQRAWSRQYMSAIFFHNEDQQRLALQSKTGEEQRRNKKIQTEILPFTEFYLAEDYHQKYHLRQHQDLMREFMAFYSRNIDFINSTAAARVNGYVGGYGTSEEIEANLDRLGLSAGSQKKLVILANQWRN